MTVYLPDVWRCIPRPERDANLRVAAAVPGMAGFVLTSTVQPAFNVITPISFRNKRRQAWVNAMKITFSMIDFGSGPVSVILINRQWMTDLYNCNVVGDCLLADPVCSIINFYGAPILA